MPYVTKNDDISVLPLSVRSQNCLRRADIQTIGAMMEYPADEFINIRNMGVRSVEEITTFVRNLKDGAGEYILLEGETKVDDRTASAPASRNSEMTVFLDGNGSVIQDIAITELPLSVRAKNSLTRSGYMFASQLVGITYDELMNLQNMGKKTAEEVLGYIAKISVKCGDFAASDESTDMNSGLAAEMCAAYGGSESVWMREIRTIKGQHPDAMGENLIYLLYESVFVRGSVKTKILQIIEDNNNGISHTALAGHLPQHLGNTTILEEILIELESASAVEVGEVMIHRQYPSVVQFVMQMKDERVKEIWQARLAGKTLQEIGDQYGLTRERVRQLSQKGLKNKPQLREDKYTYIYNNYDFYAEDMFLAFDEPQETYHYLEMISTVPRARRKPIEKLLTDTSIPAEQRRRAERAVYKEYVTIDGVRVRKYRPDLVKHFVRVLCREQTKYDDFQEMYHAQLDALDLSDNSSYVLDSRTYENILRDCDYVLWNYNRSFRYYNIPEHDCDELLSTLNLGEYENVEISALKLFRDYPDLMRQYDIKDEFELHNLLKKICSDSEAKINFRRTPTIEIGTIDRDDQVLSLLLQYAPVSGEEFACRYEETYGIKAQTVLANYMGSFAPYYFNGVYSIDFAALPATQVERMRGVLVQDFYTIQEIKRLYKREFPDGDESLINPYNLKTMDFRVYSGYVIRNTYSTAAEYFRYLLTTDDIVDARNISKSILYVVAYSSELYRLRADYEIVEFSPLQYINIRRLNEAGVTIEQFRNYCRDVFHHCEKGEYFTIASLRQDGFTHEMDDLGFDEWFYSSVLLEDRERFSYQRIGGTRLFLCGKPGANLGDMLVWLLEKYEKIDFYDLQDLLENQYGIVLPKEKLLTIIGGTELYYDTIMEAVYIDYDTYFEEI